MTPYPKSAPAPGTLIAGKFKVRGVLGIGGMSVVVEAEHMNLCLPVALKLLPRSKGRSASRVSRFHQEARIIAALTSQHVPRVMDIGVSENGDHFVVMERLQGHDLSEELELRGALRVVDAIDYVLQACQPLAEMHTLGLVHRDIKPANLFLAEPGLGRPAMLKLLDFGLSKAGGLSITQTTARLGTLTYMSPEQIRSSKYVDARSDQFSLALVLYQLLTNHPAFPGRDVAAITNSILTKPPRPMRELRGDLPAELESVIFRALDKDPNLRFATLYELAQALAPFGGEAARALLPTIHAATLPIKPKVRRSANALPRLNFSEDSSSSEHTRKYADPDDAETEVRMPSFAALGSPIDRPKITPGKSSPRPNKTAKTNPKRPAAFNTRVLWWFSLFISAALAAALAYSLLRR